jgi:hypothetical protein
VLVDTGEEGKKRADCLTLDLANGLDSCKWVVRNRSYKLELLYQFDNAHLENKTYKDRDDSFLKKPMKISFYDEELNETLTLEMTPYRLDYTVVNGKDAVYLDFSNPRVTTNFKSRSFVMLEIKSELYFFDIRGYETICEMVK